jgi:hypothetical protein
MVRLEKGNEPAPPSLASGQRRLQDRPGRFAGILCLNGRKTRHRSFGKRQTPLGTQDNRLKLAKARKTKPPPVFRALKVDRKIFRQVARFDKWPKDITRYSAAWISHRRRGASLRISSLIQD